MHYQVLYMAKFLDPFLVSSADLDANGYISSSPDLLFCPLNSAMPGFHYFHVLFCVRHRSVTYTNMHMIYVFVHCCVQDV